MVSIQNLSVEFSAKSLFDGISYVINKRDRIALVGKNGAEPSLHPLIAYFKSLSPIQAVQRQNIF